MPQLEYFIVSESISVDRDRNQVSIFNILEEVTVPKSGPAFIPHLVALGSWIPQPEEIGKDFQVMLNIVSPVAENLDKPLELSTNFRGTTRRHRVYNRILGFPLPQTGDVVFSLLLNGHHEASHTLTVRQQEDSD